MLHFLCQAEIVSKLRDSNLQNRKSLSEFDLPARHGTTEADLQRGHVHRTKRDINHYRQAFHVCTPHRGCIGVMCHGATAFQVNVSAFSPDICHSRLTGSCMGEWSWARLGPLLADVCFTIHVPERPLLDPPPHTPTPHPKS